MPITSTGRSKIGRFVNLSLCEAQPASGGIHRRVPRAPFLNGGYKIRGCSSHAAKMSLWRGTLVIIVSQYSSGAWSRT